MYELAVRHAVRLLVVVLAKLVFVFMRVVST